MDAHSAAASGIAMPPPPPPMDEPQASVVRPPETGSPPAPPPMMAPVITRHADAARPQSAFAQQLAAEAEALRNAPKGQGGIKDLAKGNGRQEMYRLNPYALRVREGWNSRDMANPKNIEHVDELARSIAEVGVQEPMRAVWEDGAPHITNGHCRLLAVYRAIEVYGAEVRSVPVYMDSKHASAADLLLTQLVSNSGKSLEPLEMSDVMCRLKDLGWTEAQIAQKTGKSAARVIQLLSLRAAPKEVRALVNTGKIAAATAAKVLKSHGPAAAAPILEAAVKTAEAKGLPKATPKHLDPASRPQTPKQVIGGIFKAARVKQRGIAVTIEIDAIEWTRVCNLLEIDSQIGPEKA